MLDNPYFWLKWAHIVSFTVWMAGLFYLPRLYVYHAGVTAGSEPSELFKVMERRLLRAITTPAMILTFVFGLILMKYHDLATSGWLHAKLTLLFLLVGYHGWLARIRKQFERDQNTRTPRFYKWLNETATVLFLLITFLAVFKPF